MSQTRSGRRPVVLTIAGSDPTAGAGIQADLKTFAALEVDGASVLTAVTSQGRERVSSIYPLPPEVVLAQLEAVLGEFPVACAKTGMLATGVVIETVARALHRINVPVVVDPVLRATVGQSLLEPGAVTRLVKEVLPLATLITPNGREAEVLCAERGIEARDAARRLSELGARAVLVTGGDGPGPEVIDLLLENGRFTEFRRPRIGASATHGTGCTLSAAIAAYLSRGCTLPEAVAQAGDYLHGALAAAWSGRAGDGRLDHLYRSRSDR
ncbi:MAG: bifunctional hydroxymethylpyrimidine kinase/phosphomethylpyrimidine kinase [Acidobacteriota bacterium]